MSWRSLQIRAFVADNVQFVLVALIVLTMVGGFFTYNTHVDPGTEVETVSESNWTSTAEYTHRADVEPGTPGLPPVIENQPVYVKSPAPELEGAYRYTYRATDGGNLSVTIDQTLVLRSSDDETEYWKVEERDLGVTTRQGVEPGDVVTNTFEINVTEAASRWERIDESYGGTPGTKEIRVESEVYISGTRNGERIEETRVDGLDIDVDGNLYYVEEDWRKTDSGGQVGEKTIPATYGPVRTAGSPLLLALSLCGLALLGAGYRHDVFEISAPEQAWIDYRGATSEFGEWISVGKIPEETRFQTTIRVDNLGDLVDIAIDSNRRVIRDDFRDLYAVLLEETMYTFEPPEEPAGETGLVARYATVVESAVPNRISSAIPADSPDNPDDRHRDTAERSGDPGQVTDRQTTIKRASPQARRVHETTEDGERSGAVPTTSQAVLDSIERLRDWVRRRVGATDGAVTAEKSRDRRADGESLDSPTGVQVTDRETSVERATEQERGADEGTETETADAVEQSKLERTLFDGNEDTGEDRANPGSGRSSNRTLRDRIDRLGAFVRTRVHRSRDERPRGGPDQSTDDQAVDSSAPGQVTDEETAVERGERKRRPGGAPEAGSETGVTERDWFSRLSSGIRDPDDETAARKATADNDRAAIRSRLQEAETLLGKASEQTETRAYSGAYRSYRAAREHLEAARAVAHDGAVPEPQEIASKLETVQEGMQDLRTKPLERAEAARDRARSTDDLQASITAWREAFEHYRDALTAGWGTDLEFEGHRDEIQRETEVVVETLVDRHQELATRFEREGDELTDTDVTAAIDNYLEALDQLRQARELATEFRGGSTEKIEEQSGRVARKHAIQRVDILAGDLSENIRNGSSRRSEVNLAIIAKEAWRHVDTGDAELSIESSMVFPANKAHMLALFEAVYENSVTYGRSEVSVRVGTTEEGFYVKDDGPGAVPLDETVFNWGETRNASPGDDEFLTHGTTLEGPGWSVRLAAGVHGGLRFELFPSNSEFVRS